MLVAVVWLLAQLGQVEAKLPDPAAPFTGGVVFLTFSPPSTPNVVLRDARVRQLGGKAFLVGRAVTATGDGFPADRATWVAVDSIANIVEFKSVDELRRRYQGQPQTK